MAKSVLPWSLKGVSPEAREIAKKAAAQQGITIGEWVSRAIRDVGPDQGLTVARTADASVRAEPALNSAADQEDLRAAVRQRIYDAEEQVAHVVGPLQDIIEQMARRLTRLEEEADSTLADVAPAEDRRQLDGW